MIIKITETEKVSIIEISFNKDCNFDVYKEVKQLLKRLKKENCFYPWYVFDDCITNLHSWVVGYKGRELNDSNIYDFVKNNYGKDKR